eukprot:363119-Chlamydomonas_euryale.AAC.2
MVRVCLWQRNEELLHTRTARKLRAPLQRIDTAVCHSSPSFLDDFEHKAGLNASSRRATWAWGCQYRKGVGASVSAANLSDGHLGALALSCHHHPPVYSFEMPSILAGRSLNPGDAGDLCTRGRGPRVMLALPPIVWDMAVLLVGQRSVNKRRLCGTTPLTERSRPITA